MEKIQITITKKHLTIVAVVLMVALVVGMGAMTYARYISSYNSGEQIATAAKWGFVVSANADNLFPSDYTLATGSHATKTDDGVAVDASAATLAPGTTGYVSITVNGTAEVRAKLTMDLTISSQVGYDNTYLPIKWALTNSADFPASGEWKTSNDIIDEVDELSQTIDAGTTVDGKYYIHWCWDLETGADDATKAANNRHDTIIGAMSAHGDNLTNINATIGGTALTDAELAKYNNVLSFSLTATIEQIQ